MTTFLKCTISLFVIISLGVQTSSAQNNNQSDNKKGAGFFTIGTSFIDIGGLNDQLEAAGYPTFDRAALSIGGGGYGVVAGVLMIGGEGHGVIGGEEAYQGRSISIGGGYGLFNLGYLRRLTPDLRAYPMLGIGGGGFSMNIGNTGDADSFEDILQDPNRQATVGRGSFLVSLSAGIEYLFKEEDGGFLLGLRVGYLMTPFQSNWRLGGNTLSDSPAASLGGPFLHLTIGGGR